MKYEITDIAHPHNQKLRLADAQAKIYSGEIKPNEPKWEEEA